MTASPVALPLNIRPPYTERDLLALQTLPGRVYGGRYGNRVQCYIGRGHPYANKSGMQWRSRLVAMAHLGQKLRPDEHVHHVNGIEDDDRPENFEILIAEFHGAIHCALTPIGEAYRKSGGQISIRYLEAPGLSFAAHRRGPIISVRPIRQKFGARR